ncbi:sulfate adenylyltransferase subunit CysN, partial [Vibrio parahaemolyticus]
MPWYHGRPLLDYLETAEVEDRNVAAPFRLFVQTVIRPHQDFRGFAGTVSSGSIRPGDSVLAAPGGHLA